MMLLFAVEHISPGRYLATRSLHRIQKHPPHKEAGVVGENKFCSRFGLAATTAGDQQTTKAELTAAEDALRAPPTVDPSSNEGEAEGEANAKAEAPKVTPAPQGELAFPGEAADSGGKA